MLFTYSTMKTFVKRDILVTEQNVIVNL